MSYNSSNILICWSITKIKTILRIRATTYSFLAQNHKCIGCHSYRVQIYIDFFYFPNTFTFYTFFIVSLPEILFWFFAAIGIIIPNLL